jgi:hypothetical protein
MDHQNFQEAIAQLSTNEGMNSEEIRSQFNLSREDMSAMQSYSPLVQATVPRPILCCCCLQNDN